MNPIGNNMNTAALLCSVVLFVPDSPLQEGQVKVSPATSRYHELRFKSTEPSFGLAKVKGLIKQIKPKKIDDESAVLATTAWNRLSTAEKFTYCMLHGELSTQNCDAMPWVVDEENKVFAYPPPFLGGELMWSDRQKAFLKSHRGEVVRLLRSTIRSKGEVGVNLKVATYEINADELIPDLISVYRKGRKDQDILTLLMLLMKDGKYKPFLSSTTYRKLYGENASYQSYIVANEANQKLMFDRAMGYYRSRVR
ncbi:hypothetical protein EON82_13520 [bacterium]|nr:MAG: hypothetical protein EON82_13520 [bacterium]